MNVSLKKTEYKFRINRTMILNIIAPFCLGFLIYVIFRSNSIFNIVDKDLIEIWNIPEWIKFNLPDGLWLYSLNSIIILIWEYKSRFALIFWLSFSTSISIIIEFLQLHQIIRGTFDINDIFAYLISIIALILFLIIKNNQLENKR
jgi:hypothetical protein